MADNVSITQGSGTTLATADIGGAHFQKTILAGVSACRLAHDYTVAELVTCTNANTDYNMATAMASGTKYLTVYCASACVVAMGTATSTTVGVAVGAGMPTTFPVTVTGTAADDKCHVQSPTAGAVVRFTSMID